ncbi:MAG: hypothetical protein WC319_10190 [Candidatus Paceibacterota bacterium]
MSISDMLNEIGVRTSTTIGTYDEEENPDKISIDRYIQMQDTDGTVRAITRLFAMPIQSTTIKILPGENDKGERDFIETVFTKPEFVGGMSTPISFVIADMTRAIFEGFRVFEKVPQIIKEGKYKGKIGWRKIATRDASTIALKVDENGGFNGVHQQAYFGSKMVNVDIPKEKCILFTFQKERHPLYGESILKTAYYHYDKKHKLYYLAHKKAEIDAVGLKILKVVKPTNDSDIKDAEDAVDSIGVNSRVTLPNGYELEIDRAPSGGYDVLKLIEHHDQQICLSTLTQAMSLGTKSTYAYPYGGGYDAQSLYIVQMLQSVLTTMEDVINQWAIPQLIDWNFGSGSYPKIKLMPIKEESKDALIKIFQTIISKQVEGLNPAFLNSLTLEVAKTLGLDIKQTDEMDAMKAFEAGKKEVFDKNKKPATTTPESVKKDVKKKAIDLKDDPFFLEKFKTMGKNFAMELIK